MKDIIPSSSSYSRRVRRLLLSVDQSFLSLENTSSSNLLSFLLTSSWSTMEQFSDSSSNMRKLSFQLPLLLLKLTSRNIIIIIANTNIKVNKYISPSITIQLILNLLFSSRKKVPRMISSPISLKKSC